MLFSGSNNGWENDDQSFLKHPRRNIVIEDPNNLMVKQEGYYRDIAIK